MKILLRFTAALFLTLALSGCGVLWRLGDGGGNYHGKEMQRYWDHSHMHY